MLVTALRRQLGGLQDLQHAQAKPRFVVAGLFAEVRGQRPLAGSEFAVDQVLFHTRAFCGSNGCASQENYDDAARAGDKQRAIIREKQCAIVQALCVPIIRP